MTTRTESREVGTDLFELQDDLAQNITDDNDEDIFVKWTFVEEDTKRTPTR